MLGMATIGYARVSTDQQTTDQQIDALKGAGCERIFGETVSSRRDLPELAACLDYLRAGDTLVVWRLDRLGRSVSHLTSTVQDIEARGITLRSLREVIDTSTASGKLVLGIFAVLAEFERDLVQERTIAALAAKKARGEPLGRRPALNSEQVAAARTLIAQGDSIAAVARTFGVGRSTVYRHLNAATAQ